MAQSEVGYIFPEDAAKQVVEVGNAIQKTDNALLKYTEDASKLITLLKEQNISFEQLQKVQKEATETTVKLDAIGKSLLQSETKLKEVTDKRTESIIRNRAETRNATRDIQLKVRAQQAEKGSIEQLSAVNAILEKRLKSVNLATTEGAKKAEILRNAINRNTAKIMDSSSEFSKWKINIGNYPQLTGLVGTLGQLPGPLGNAANGLATMGKAMWALVANPIGAVIAAITIALTSLYKIFKSTDEGATTFNAVLKAMGNIVDVVIDRMVSFYKMIWDIVTLDFKGVKENAQDAFGGIGDSLRDAAKAGWEYEQVMDAISDRESASLVRQSKLKKEIEELTQASKNRMLGTKEQIRLAELATSKAVELNQLENSFEQARTEAAKKNLASKINIQNLTVQQREDLLEKWTNIDDRELDSAREKDAEFAKFYNNNEDEIKNLQKLKSEDLDRDRELLTSTRRLNTSLFGFKKQLYDDEQKEIKETQEAEKKRLEEEQKASEKRAKMWADEVWAKQEAENEKIKANEKYNADFEKQIEDEQKLIDEKLDNEVAATIAAGEKILEEKQKLAEKEADQRKQNEEQFKQDAINQGLELGNFLFENKKKQLELEFQAAEGNAAKQAEIKKKIAQQDKTQALFNIAVNTAVAISKVLGQTGIFGLAAWIPIAALGAVQSGIVMAQKIPKFATGTDYAPNEFIAGEKGRELVKTKSGDLVMAKKATHFKGNKFKGATVYTNKETEQIISQSGFGNNFVFDTRELRDGLKAVEKAINKKPVMITDNSGRIVGKESNNYRETYLNRMQNGR